MSDSRRLRRCVRFLFGSVPRFLMTGAALTVMAFGGLLGFAWLTWDGRGCPQAVARASEAEVTGEYRGPSGMKLRLRYDAGDGKGTFSVVHWPYEDSPSYRKKKTFDETGEWSLHEIGGEAGAWVTLNFWDMPYSFGRQPLEKLMVGRDGDERVLFTETDPDNCPDVVLRRSE